VQHFTRFQLTMCSHGSSALAELLVFFVVVSFVYDMRFVFKVSNIYTDYRQAHGLWWLLLVAWCTKAHQNTPKVTLRDCNTHSGTCRIANLH